MQGMELNELLEFFHEGHEFEFNYKGSEYWLGPDVLDDNNEYLCICTLDPIKIIYQGPCIRHDGGIDMDLISQALNTKVFDDRTHSFMEIEADVRIDYMY